MSWSFNPFKKRVSSRRHALSLEEPKFEGAEKAILRTIMKFDDGVLVNDYWAKVHDYLLWWLMQLVLSRKISDEYRQGFLECLETLDNLPIFDSDETASVPELDGSERSMMTNY